MSVLRWGFMGAGKCTSDFVTSLSLLPQSSHKTIGIASRDLEKAKEFAKRLSIPKSFGSYEELAQDPEIDIVYVGTVNSEHFEQAKLAVKHGKHVLIEKPICINFNQAKELVVFAKAKSVFLMEGYWTNCFPAMSKLREELEKNIIGDLVHISLEIGNKFGHMDRFRLKELGGGIILNHGVYGIMMACQFLGKPDKVRALGHLSVDKAVDETAVITLSYSKTGQMATILCSSKAKMPAELRLIGTEGTIKVPYPFWAPTSLETPNETFNFPLPPPPETLKYNYLFASGFIYEAEEIRRCIQQGHRESSRVPLQLSLDTMEICDEVRKQIFSSEAIH